VIRERYEDVGIHLARDGKSVRVGMTEMEAFQAFPRPRSGYDFFEVPTFLSDQFEGRGWETSAETFATISRAGRVILALYTLENATRDQAAAIVEMHTRKLPETAMVTSKTERAHYYFWQLEDQRAMVCVGFGANGKSVVTAAVGIAELMDAYRMGPNAAREDQARLSRQNNGASPGPRNE
jgi:hypothetical protein